jgi:hypothetical protein
MVRRRRAAGVGGKVAGGPFHRGGEVGRGRRGGPVRGGGGTWRGRCPRWGRLGGAAFAADRRCGAEPVAGGRDWWAIWFRVACGGWSGSVAHGTAGGGRPWHRLGFPFANGRRRLLGGRRLLAPHRHRPRRSAGLIQTWTVWSPPTRPNGRALLRVALDHRARTRPTFSWAPVGLLLRTRVGLLLRTRVGLLPGARVVLGVRVWSARLRGGPLRLRHRRPWRLGVWGGTGRRGAMDLTLLVGRGRRRLSEALAAVVGGR